MYNFYTTRDMKLCKTILDILKLFKLYKNILKLKKIINCKNNKVINIKIY